jgi:hypothetical protein
VLCCCLLTACVDTETRKEGGAEPLDHSKIPQYEIHGTVLSDTSALGIPTDLVLLDRYIVVLDLAADSVVHIVDRRTGRLVRQLGRRGEGPAEFKSAWTVSADPDDDGIAWIYDIERLRWVGVGIHSSAVREELFITSTVTFSADGMPTGPLWIDSSTAVSLGFFGAGRIGIFDSNGSVKGVLGSLPHLTVGASPTVAQHVYQGTLGVHPSRPLVAVVTRHASQIEIYALDSSSAISKSGPLPIEPSYRVRRGPGGDMMQGGADMRFGYIDVAVSENAVFALFSGRTRQAFPGRAYLGSHVHVFDWAGEFLYSLKLDGDIITIALSESQAALYAVRHNPIPAIVRYDIGEEMPSGSR